MNIVIYAGCTSYCDRFLMVEGNMLLGLAIEKQSGSGSNFSFSLDYLCFIVFQEQRSSRTTPAELGPHFKLKITPIAV